MLAFIDDTLVRLDHVQLVMPRWQAVDTATLDARIGQFLIKQVVDSFRIPETHTFVYQNEPVWV